MVPFSNFSKNKTLKSFIDITAGIKLIVINPILKKENLFKKNQNLPGSVFIRSWIRTPCFYKKFIGQALDWEYRKGMVNNKEKFYKMIAESQNINFQNYPLLKNLKNILLEDMGHKGLIFGDENIIAVLVANQLKKEVSSVPYLINGRFAVDFKINDVETGGGVVLDMFFEIKPGTDLCRQHNLI
jgi:hypothetical protein